VLTLENSLNQRKVAEIWVVDLDARRGKNSDVAVGFGLEFFRPPPAHSFPTFGFHFQFQFPQRAGRISLQAHRVPFIRGFRLLGE
jgi:hypothetical protein